MVIKEIAVLITCHNRKDKTLQCLEALYLNKIPEDYSFEVFLVDDGSTDNTSIAVKENFSNVNIIQGNGNLYWNQGMRLAWETAAEKQEYDFYLWLNDDTVLDIHTINELIECGKEASLKEVKQAIISGACRMSDEEIEFSYGGRTEVGPVIPNGKLQQCTYINGNVVLIPNEVYKTLGNLSKDYTHAMGDFDYGLRAIKAGIKCYTTHNYIGICELNQEISAWCNPKTPILKRLKLLHTPNGLNIKEYKIFRKKFWNKTYWVDIVKVYLKCIFPAMYNVLKINTEYE